MAVAPSSPSRLSSSPNTYRCPIKSDPRQLGYTYDADGNETSYADGADNTTTYGYNSLGEMTSSTDALGNTTDYSYDDNGNKVGETLPDSDTITWTYNGDNLVTGISYSDDVTPSVSYTYSPDGKVTEMTDGSGTSTYSYDDADRLSSYENGNDESVSYGYDDAGNVTSITYPNAETVSEGYNAMDELSSVTDWNSNETTFSYDGDGNLTAIDYPNGITDTRVYDDADELSSITDTDGATTIMSFSYSRDDDGNVTSETDYGTPGAGTITDTYSSLSELTASGSESYTYDDAENLTTSPSGDTQGYNADDEVCYQGSGSGTCSSPPAGATTYSYSAEGNRTATTPSSGTSYTYSFDEANELTGVTPSTGSSTSYVYDGNGLLQSETTGASTTEYTWNVQPSLPLLLSDGTNYYLYGPDDTPIEQINVSSGATSYLLSDELGSIRAITSSSGSVTGAFTYDAWGNETGSSGSATTPFGFAGYYLDQASGFYYLQARWYDAETGQFVSVDPEVTTTNEPYSYGANDPVNVEDSSGEICSPAPACTITRSTPTLTAMAFFITDYGLQPYQAAAIVGNLLAESGLNPSCEQSGSGLCVTSGGGPGFGIAQWSNPGPRFTALLKYASSQGVPGNWASVSQSLVVQLMFVGVEMTSGYDGDYAYTMVMANLKKQSNLTNATNYIQVYYEGGTRSRVAEAEEAFNDW